jgi:transcriptional regulator with XRE-family HTH domain
MAVDKATLGERLLLVRTRREWSPASVAAGAGISEARLYHIERGDVWPEPAVLVKLCQALGVDDKAMLEEGDEWYARLKGIGAIGGPHAFDLPTQFDPALSVDVHFIPPPGVKEAEDRKQPERARRANSVATTPPAVGRVVMCGECGRRPRWSTSFYCYDCGMQEATDE